MSRPTIVIMTLALILGFSADVFLRSRGNQSAAGVLEEFTLFGVMLASCLITTCVLTSPLWSGECRNPCSHPVGWRRS
jgi:hypothetical protein